MEGEDRVRTGMNGAIDHPGEVNTKKGKHRIRDWINECFDQITLFRDQFVVFSSERDDLDLGILPRLLRYSIALQTSAIDQKPTLDLVASGPEVMKAVAPSYPVHLSTGLHDPAVSANQLRILRTYGTKTHNSCRAHLNSSQASNMWLNLPYFLTGKPDDIEPVLDSAMVKVIEQRQFLLFCRNDDFSAYLMSNPVFPAEIDHGAVSFPCETRFEAAGFVINAGMYYTTVPSGLVQSQLRFFLEHNELQPRLPPEQSHADTQSDNTATHNYAINLHSSLLFSSPVSERLPTLAVVILPEEVLIDLLGAQEILKLFQAGEAAVVKNVGRHLHLLKDVVELLRAPAGIPIAFEIR